MPFFKVAREKSGEEDKLEFWSWNRAWTPKPRRRIHSPVEGSDNGQLLFFFWFLFAVRSTEGERSVLCGFVGNESAQGCKKQEEEVWLLCRWENNTEMPNEIVFCQSVFCWWSISQDLYKIILTELFSRIFSAVVNENPVFFESDLGVFTLDATAGAISEKTVLKGRQRPQNIRLKYPKKDVVPFIWFFHNPASWE